MPFLSVSFKRLSKFSYYPKHLHKYLMTEIQMFTLSFLWTGVKVQPLHTERIRWQQDVMMHIQRVFLGVKHWHTQSINIRRALQSRAGLDSISVTLLTVNLQVTAVFLCPSCYNQVISGFNLKILPLVMILQTHRGSDRHRSIRWTIKRYDFSSWVCLTVSLRVMYGSSSLVPNTVSPARLSPRFDVAA